MARRVAFSVVAGDTIWCKMFCSYLYTATSLFIGRNLCITAKFVAKELIHFFFFFTCRIDAILLFGLHKEKERQ